MSAALISLGSNLGDRAATLASALAALAATPDVRVVRASKFFETSPVGGPGFQEPFLNAAAILETTLEPEALLDELQRVENEHGRVREEHWGPRTLDLDLLTYDDLVLHTPRLTLPHPRMSYRKFVLRGVVEIAPYERHPMLGGSFSELLQNLDIGPNYATFLGMTEGFRSQFAAEAADCATAKLVDATPRDIPTFGELIAAPSLDISTALGFIDARADSIERSIADAGDKWIIDDGWLAAEAEELAMRLVDKDRGTLLIVCEGLRMARLLTPKLLATIRTKDQPPFAAALEPRQPASLPAIDLDISDRERALTEFAAALDAAR